MESSLWVADAPCEAAARTLFRRLDVRNARAIGVAEVLPLWPMLTEHLQSEPGAVLLENLQQRRVPISFEDWMGLMGALREILGSRRFKNSVWKAEAAVAETLAKQREEKPRGIIPYAELVSELPTKPPPPPRLPLPGAILTTPNAVSSSSKSMLPATSPGSAPAPGPAPVHSKASPYPASQLPRSSAVAAAAAKSIDINVNVDDKVAAKGPGKGPGLGPASQEDDSASAKMAPSSSSSMWVAKPSSSSSSESCADLGGSLLLGKPRKLSEIRRKAAEKVLATAESKEEASGEAPEVEPPRACASQAAPEASAAPEQKAATTTTTTTAAAAAAAAVAEAPAPHEVLPSTTEVQKSQTDDDADEIAARNRSSTDESSTTDEGRTLRASAFDLLATATADGRLIAVLCGASGREQRDEEEEEEDEENEEEKAEAAEPPDENYEEDEEAELLRAEAELALLAAVEDGRLEGALAMTRGELASPPAPPPTGDPFPEFLEEEEEEEEEAREARHAAPTQDPPQANSVGEEVVEEERIEQQKQQLQQQLQPLPERQQLESRGNAPSSVPSVIEISMEDRQIRTPDTAVAEDLVVSMVERASPDHSRRSAAEAPPATIDDSSAASVQQDGQEPSGPLSPPPLPAPDDSHVGEEAAAGAAPKAGADVDDEEGYGDEDEEEEDDFAEQLRLEAQRSLLRCEEEGRLEAALTQVRGTTPPAPQRVEEAVAFPEAAAEPSRSSTKDREQQQQEEDDEEKDEEEAVAPRFSISISAPSAPPTPHPMLPVQPEQQATASEGDSKESSSPARGSVVQRKISPSIMGRGRTSSQDHTGGSRSNSPSPSPSNASRQDLRSISSMTSGSEEEDEEGRLLVYAGKLVYQKTTAEDRHAMEEHDHRLEETLKRRNTHTVNYSSEGSHDKNSPRRVLLEGTATMPKLVLWDPTVTSGFHSQGEEHDTPGSDSAPEPSDLVLAPAPAPPPPAPAPAGQQQQQEEKGEEEEEAKAVLPPDVAAAEPQGEEAPRGEVEVGVFGEMKVQRSLSTEDGDVARSTTMKAENTEEKQFVRTSSLPMEGLTSSGAGTPAGRDSKESHHSDGTGKEAAGNPSQAFSSTLSQQMGKGRRPSMLSNPNSIPPSPREMQVESADKEEARAFEQRYLDIMEGMLGSDNELHEEEEGARFTRPFVAAKNKASSTLLDSVARGGGSTKMSATGTSAELQKYIQPKREEEEDFTPEQTAILSAGLAEHSESSIPKVFPKPEENLQYYLMQQQQKLRAQALKQQQIEDEVLQQHRDLQKELMEQQEEMRREREVHQQEVAVLKIEHARMDEQRQALLKQIDQLQAEKKLGEEQISKAHRRAMRRQTSPAEGSKESTGGERPGSRGRMMPAKSPSAGLGGLGFGMSGSSPTNRSPRPSPLHSARSMRMSPRTPKQGATASGHLSPLTPDSPVEGNIVTSSNSNIVHHLSSGSADAGDNSAGNTTNLQIDMSGILPPLHTSSLRTLPPGRPLGRHESAPQLRSFGSKSSGDPMTMLERELEREREQHYEAVEQLKDVARRLRIATAKLKNPEPPKRPEKRYGVSNAAPYSESQRLPPEVPKRNQKAVVLPAVRSLPQMTPEQQQDQRHQAEMEAAAARKACMAASQRGLDRKSKSMTRIEAIAKLDSLGMNTWQVRKAEKVARLKDVRAFGESMWGSFWDWKEEANLMD